MKRETFFNALGNLSPEQIDGMSALLAEGERVRLPLHHMANVLANVHRETGGLMYPIKETVMPYHKNKNPTDAEVKRRLDVAFKAGKLPWVKTPYWADGWFGRGQIQITHRANYAKWGISNPDDALRPHISARIAVAGMMEGKFTGKRLGDYTFPADLDEPPATNPRRIVNGPDGSDREVASAHRRYAAALQAAGWGVASKPLTSKPVDGRKPPETVINPVARPATGGFIAALIRAIVALFTRRK